MFGFLKKAFEKTNEAIKEIVPQKQQTIDKDTFEEVLLEADVNYDLIEKILDTLPKKISKDLAYNSLITIFQYETKKIEPNDYKPFVEMIIGVNGAGKTTTIAKLANLYKKEGHNVILGAGDTFRAAAIEQLTKWADRLDIPIVSTRQGHDPSAVIYDTILKAKAKKFDRVILDTAGRLHTQTNLAQELKKMVRVANKALPEAPHRKILILDGTQGSSTINQAKAFNEMVGIDGVIVTKLDGTAKGGAILTIADELKLPIYYIGTGETPDDLAPFKASEFINMILDEIFE